MPLIVKTEIVSRLQDKAVNASVFYELSLLSTVYIPPVLSTLLSAIIGHLDG